MTCHLLFFLSFKQNSPSWFAYIEWYYVISFIFASVYCLHAFKVEQIREHEWNKEVFKVKYVGIEHLKVKGLLI